MAIVYSYPLNKEIRLSDELVGTTEKMINGQLRTVTRNFLLQDLAEFFIVDGGLQKTITLTTNNTSGPATLDQLTGILNIPQYSGGSSQNLQQVTDIGATTTNTIVVNSNTDQNSFLAYINNYSNGFLSVVGSTSSGRPFALYNGDYDSYPYSVSASGDVNANTFVKNGGSSTEYLMADGSVTTAGIGSQNLQSVTDIGSSTTNHISIDSTGIGGDGISSTIGEWDFINDYVFTSAISGTNNNIDSLSGNPIGYGVYGKGGIGVYGTAYNDYLGYYGTGVYAIGSIGLHAEGTAVGIQAIGIDGATGLTANSGYGDAISAISNNGNAIYLSSNYGTVANLNLGLVSSGLVINSGTSSTGNPIQIFKGATSKLIVNQQGELTATKVIKQGGTSSQFLMADGSVSIAGGGVTSVTATSPITSSGGTNPVISTSMSTNKLIGRRSSTTTGAMEEIEVGSGLTLTSTGILNNTATPTPLGYYGAFQDILTQTITTVNTGQPFLIRTTDENNQVTITQDGSGRYTRITPANTGIYNIQWSGQFQNPDNAIHDINVWFRKGLVSSSGPGTDIVGSNGKVAIPARKSAATGEEGHIITGWNFVLTIVAGEYVEFYWMSDSTQITLQAYPGATPPPSTASLIVTVTQQSGIMAGTGITALNSLTGSTQTLLTGTTGTDFGIVSSGTSHVFNIPTASASNRGLLSSSNWTTFNNKLNPNAPITGSTNTKITYDLNGLVTSSSSATTADIADSTNKRYVTDANLVVIGNTSGTNTGDNATNTQYSGLAESKANQDGTVLYHSTRWFTPTSTVSSSGTTVTSIGTQFTTTMVNSKLTISGESRIVTAFISTTQVTVASAYSINYSGIAAANWGIYSRSYDSVTISGGGLYNNTGTSWASNSSSGALATSGILSGGSGFFLQFGSLDVQNAYLLRFSSTSVYSGTKDLGLRRNATGVLELYDGVTADGTDVNRRDLLVRNLTSTGTLTSKLGPNAFYANNTASTANGTEQVFKDVAEATDLATVSAISWNGTAPTSPISLNYKWNQVGSLVTVRFNLVYTTAGASNSQLTISLPSTMPTPASPSGFTSASDVICFGSGSFSSSKVLPTIVGIITLRKNSAGTGFEFIMTRTAGNINSAWIIIQYFV